jgi:4-amino-4-deoxy-L-arabinose transferase-like glycosyltransferase
VRRLTLVALGAGLAVRLVVAALTPVFPDEAYYWEWSRHLAAGYFDHPPAIAWLIAAGTALFGVTPLGIRFWAVVAGGGATACVVAIARRIGGDAAGLRAAVLLLCIPLVMPGLATATTDAPALAAIAAALLSIALALEAPLGSSASTRWWIAAGVAFGVGLLSKLTVGLVGAAVAVALVSRPSLRAQLRLPAPWLAVLCTAIVATPLLWWNARHDWISFRFQLAHGLGAPARGTMPGRELAFIGGQLALLSPGVAVLAVVAGWRALRQRDDPRPDPTARPATDLAFLLAVVGGVVLAFFAYSAVRRPVEPNWPAPAFVALLPLAAASAGLTTRRWWRPSLAVGALLVAVALAQTAAPVLPVAARRDPIARAHGWPAVASAADSLRRSPPAAGHAWLAADRYQDAAEIALLARGHPTVFALGIGSRHSQYDLWPSFARTAHRGDDLVVALDTDASEYVAATLRPHFATAARGPRVALTRGGDTVAVRAIWRLSGWRGSWPEESPDGH